MPAKKKARPKYQVIRDTREQQGWTFPASDVCEGTVVETMKTGDYTLAGYEKLFVIERKKSTGELAQNLFEARFHRELERMDSFEEAYLFLEFTWEDVVRFPEGSGIPKDKWSKLKTTPKSLMRSVHLLKMDHPRIHVEWVGEVGLYVASSLFKRILERHG